MEQETKPLGQLFESINYYNEEDLIKLNHYTNLQPLWSEDNLKKNRKYGN